MYLHNIFFVLHSKLENSRAIEGGRKGTHVFLEFCKYTGNMQSYIDYRPCVDNQDHDSALGICVQFSVSFFCCPEKLCRNTQNLKGKNASPGVT